MVIERLRYSLAFRLRALLRRAEVEHDLDDEMHYHVERETAYRVTRGETPATARANALREFGNVEFHKELVRDVRGGRSIDELARDVKFALRSLGRAKGFTVVVVLTLALGIGANSAVFSMIDAVLLHPLPVPRPQQVVSITEALTDQVPRLPLAYPTYRALATRAHTLSGIAVFSTRDVVVQATGEPQQIPASAVSGNYFSVLDLRPQVGRLIVPTDDDVPGAHFVAVISDALWTRAYDRSPAVVGSTIKIGNNPYTIIGVAPRRFRGTLLDEAPQVWVPAPMLADLGLRGFLSAANRSKIFGLRHFHAWSVIARLRGEPAAAAAELNTIFAQEKALYPKYAAEMGFAGRDVVRDPIRMLPINDAAAWGDRADLLRFVWILATVVMLTLLIACLNVANLFLVRSGERKLELSVRRSLGASRARIAQQLAVESLLVGIAGAIGGGMVSRAAVGLLRSFALPGNIRLADIGFDLNGRVLGVTMALGVLTALMFGLGPAITTSRVDLIATLRTTRASAQSSVRAVLLAGEVALSIVLLVGAALFVRTMQRGLHSDLGFDPAPLAAVRVNPSLGGNTGAELEAYYRGAIERASQIPGVSGVALSSHVPLAAVFPLPFVPGEKAASSGDPTEGQVSAGWVYISPNYFDVIHVPVVEGRAFTADDSTRSNSIAIINQAAAKALFPDGRSVGREMVHAGMMRFTVVGVVRDTKYASVRDSHVPMIFTPLPPRFSDAVHFIVRSSRPAAALEELRRVLRAVPPHPPLQEARLVSEQVNATLEPQRFGATLLGSYSVLALLIAAVGVYGLVAFVLSKQQREIGIRIALGAQPMQVVELVTARIAVTVGVGIIIGLLLATLGTRALDHFLYGVSATDLTAFGVAAVAMLIAALAACVSPARRALHIDPVKAMRVE